MILGFDSAIASAPIASLQPGSFPSVMLRQLVPSSVLSQRPPSTAPMYSTGGSLATPATATTRPPMKGPMERQRSALAADGACEGAAAAGTAMHETTAATV